MRDESLRLPLAAIGPASERPISIAIVAMGGQGGGVLTDWIVQLAENQGWVAQSTSVPGVAQRTGATIYYVEMMRPLNGRKPVLSLMPTPGDVDVVLASEFIEAGRSILRGIVTPDRTTLIASSHRSFAIAEKMAPGEGVADKSAVEAAIGVTARKAIIFDMEALAIRNGSVISAALFGALAGANVLPFEHAAYLDVIRTGGKGADASIRTFETAFKQAGTSTPDTQLEQPVKKMPAPTTTHHRDLAQLLARLQAEVPEAAKSMTTAGLMKVVDFQDAAYGHEYFDILKRLHEVDIRCGGEARGFVFTVTAAKYLANAMTYDDVIRVADLKTRASRRARIAKEMKLVDGQLLQTTEFMHPRLEEVLGMLPAALGRWISTQTRFAAWLDRRINKGRRVKTYSLHWFLTLYIIAGLRKLRRRSLRHTVETAHRNEWLEFAIAKVQHNYQLGVEVLQCRRLIKGYSDTHTRGLSRYDKVIATIKRLQDRTDAADWAHRLREAAVKDASGELLDGAIRTVDSFA